MKTIEQAANNYAYSRENNDYTIETEMAFCAGVEFAQRWIPVEEEFPEDNESLIIEAEDEWDATKTIKILAMTDGGTITDNRRVKMQVGEKEWVWFMNYDGETVTHWRPIELN